MTFLAAWNDNKKKLYFENKKEWLFLQFWKHFEQIVCPQLDTNVLWSRDNVPEHRIHLTQPNLLTNLSLNIPLGSMILILKFPEESVLFFFFAKMSNRWRFGNNTRLANCSPKIMSTKYIEFLPFYFPWLHKEDPNIFRRIVPRYRDLFSRKST